MTERLDYAAINSAAIARMAAAKKHMASIGARLRALIELRVSQINGCAYCVDLHTREAREAGETQQRLDCLTVWRECPFYQESERAALAWAEAVTLIAGGPPSDALFTALKAHYSDEEIVDLTLIIAQMNAWNRMAVSFGHGPKARG